MIKLFNALHGRIRFVIDIVGWRVNGINCEGVVFGNVDRKLIYGFFQSVSASMCVREYQVLLGLSLLECECSGVRSGQLDNPRGLVRVVPASAKECENSEDQRYENAQD
jgi:hypothetical protein